MTGKLDQMDDELEDDDDGDKDRLYVSEHTLCTPFRSSLGEGLVRKKKVITT